MKYWLRCSCAARCFSVFAALKQSMVHRLLRIRSWLKYTKATKEEPLAAVWAKRGPHPQCRLRQIQHLDSKCWCQTERVIPHHEFVNSKLRWFQSETRASELKRLIWGAAGHRWESRSQNPPLECKKKNQLKRHPPGKIINCRRFCSTPSDEVVQIDRCGFRRP